MLKFVQLLKKTFSVLPFIEVIENTDIFATVAEKVAVSAVVVGAIGSATVIGTGSAVVDVAMSNAHINHVSSTI